MQRAWLLPDSKDTRIFGSREANVERSGKSGMGGTMTNEKGSEIMLNLSFMDIAERAARVAVENGLPNIDPRWLYAQFVHESDNFTSRLFRENKNFGGLTQETPNDSLQPDGNYYYMNFETYKDYADYLGKYLTGYIDGGVDKAETLAEYITALKVSPSGEYFGDSLENYLSDCQRIYDQEFSV
jgi:hypothetical protein